MMDPGVYVLNRGMDLTSVTEAQWQNGCIIPVNKPLDWTSFDVVKYIKKVIPVKKVGHAGTLDPKATGLLLCCTGKATKQISQLQESIKEYSAVIRLGATSPSLDIGTEDTHVEKYSPIPLETIKTSLLRDFNGNIEQLPPAYSALKINGKRAYELARKGLEPDLKPRTVFVESIEVLQLEGALLTLLIRCGKGTYIRSIARDLGRKLGTVARLESLIRVQSGAYHVNNGWDPLEFRNQMRLSGYD